jgi:hypothetical protein
MQKGISCMPGFDEIQRLAKYVAQTTTASPEIQTQTYEESYEERYFFDLLSRTKTRSKVREVRRWWSLGLLYNHVDESHDAKTYAHGYSYEDERYLVIDGNGDLLIYEIKTGDRSFRPATENDAAKLDFDQATRSDSKRVGRNQDTWTEITRNGSRRFTEHLEGVRRALQQLQS